MKIRQKVLELRDKRTEKKFMEIPLDVFWICVCELSELNFVTNTLDSSSCGGFVGWSEETTGYMVWNECPLKPARSACGFPHAGWYNLL